MEDSDKAKNSSSTKLDPDVVTGKEESLVNQDIKENEIDEEAKERAYIEIQRKALPIFNYKEDLLKAIKESGNTLVVIGETGSGKSTQISQYLNEFGYGKKGIIGITQPRKVGAVSVARRVATEFGCEVGEEVGYSVRFSDQTSSKTIIKYMTDGILLRECLQDPSLQRYSVIILDEAHERSVNTDILFGLMKLCVQKRRDLKVLITSATLNSEKFSTFFGRCPVFFVPGRSFPVDIFYWETDRVQDYVDSGIHCVLQIHEREPQGDILMFLTGQVEIEDACKRLAKQFAKQKRRNPEVKNLLILPLYAALSPSDQVKVFGCSPANTRKVVIATNIAETSLTVDGVVYVVDPGYVKQKICNVRTGMEALQVVLISQVAASQRAGRAGRTRPGKCFRLYTKKLFEEHMEKATVPEIQRSNLANIVLTLKAMGIHDVISFEFLDPPDPFLLVQAIKQLYYLGALDADGRITSLGKQMSAFPLEPSFSRMLIRSVNLGCSREMVILVAMLSVENLLYRPFSKEEQLLADNRRKELWNEAEKNVKDAFIGDHHFLLHLYSCWKTAKNANNWCHDHFIHPKRMQEAEEIRKQLQDILEPYLLEKQSRRREESRKQSRYHLKALDISDCLCSGLFMNAARRVELPSQSAVSKTNSKGKDFAYLVLNKEQLAYIHPQSAIMLGDRPLPECILYSDLLMTSRVFMKTVFGVRMETVQQEMAKKANLNLSQLIGRDIREVVKSISSIDTNTENADLTKKLEEQQKFSRRNDDKSVQEARERYLQRRQKKL